MKSLQTPDANKVQRNKANGGFNSCKNKQAIKFQFKELTQEKNNQVYRGDKKGGMNFSSQGLALAIRPLFDEEDGKNNWD